MSDHSKHTIIEEGTEFDGSVNSGCPVEISGSLKGEVLAPALTVTRTGSVHGRIKVERLHSRGAISGQIDAESVELAGEVSDSTIINATTLEVKLDKAEGGLQVTFGNCELNVGQSASKSDAGDRRMGEALEPDPIEAPSGL